MKAEDLRYFESLVGVWDIRYSGADGKEVKDYGESLELRTDGTFSWSPTPLWAKAGGRWGVSVDAADGRVKLYFEERKCDRFRGAWLVVTPLRFGERTEMFIHWQRTRSDAVVFDDRIWRGQWKGRAG